jgi:hypothetical protein
MSASIIPTEAVDQVQQLARRAVAAGKQGAAVIVFLALWYRLGNLFLAALVGVVSVGLVLAVIDTAKFVRWLRVRRAALLAGSRPVPGLRKLWTAYRAEAKRLAYLEKQWPVACLSQGLTGPSKAIPALFDVTPTLDNSITARVASSRMGVDPEDIASRVDRIRKVIGCYELGVRETSSGCADLTFSWSNALGPVLPLGKLPPSKPGTIAYGIRSDGSAATIQQHMSVMIGGLTRKGKSNVCRAMLADLIRKQVPVDLYVADTKDGVELPEFEANVGRRMGCVRVVRYETTAGGAANMVTAMVAEKRRRGAAMRGKTKQHRPTTAEPLLVGILDETLPLHAMLKEGTKGAAGEIGFSGAAMDTVLWVNTQMGHASVVGQLRELIPQRICFSTTTWQDTDTVLGSHAANEGGALCHKIGDTPGIGWSGSDGSSRYEKFRAAVVTDEETAMLAEGRVPAMPPAFPAVVEPVEPIVRPTAKERSRALVLACRVRLLALLAAVCVWAKSTAIGAAVGLDGLRAALGWAPRLSSVVVPLVDVAPAPRSALSSPRRVVVPPVGVLLEANSAEDGSHRTFRWS